MKEAAKILAIAAGLLMLVYASYISVDDGINRILDIESPVERGLIWISLAIIFSSLTRPNKAINVRVVAHGSSEHEYVSR